MMQSCINPVTSLGRGACGEGIIKNCTPLNWNDLIENRRTACSAF